MSGWAPPMLPAPDGVCPACKWPGAFNEHSAACALPWRAPPAASLNQDPWAGPIGAPAAQVEEARVLDPLGVAARIRRDGFAPRGGGGDIEGHEGRVVFDFRGTPPRRPLADQEQGPVDLGDPPGLASPWGAVQAVAGAWGFDGVPGDLADWVRALCVRANQYSGDEAERLAHQVAIATAVKRAEAAEAQVVQANDLLADRQRELGEARRKLCGVAAVLGSTPVSGPMAWAVAPVGSLGPAPGDLRLMHAPEGRPLAEVFQEERGDRLARAIRTHQAKAKVLGGPSKVADDDLWLDLAEVEAGG